MTPLMAFFILINYTAAGCEEFPVIDNGTDGEPLLIKFMSDHGTTDDAQGAAFKQYLDNNGYTYESTRLRSYMVTAQRAIAILNRIFVPE